MNSIKTYVEGKSLKVFFIISYQGKRFQVYTGITSTVKFSGMIFPKSVPNARAKTAMLARLFASVEEYIYMNGELPAARMKDEIKAIINGRAASVEKNILYYIDEFIKTKAKDSTKEIFLRTRKRIESFDEHADFDNIDRDWLERFQAHELLKGRMSGGIAIDLRNIRTVFNWAIDNEITTKYPFRKFSIKTERQQYLYLSAEEMREYQDTELMEKYCEHLGYSVEDYQEFLKGTISESFLGSEVIQTYHNSFFGTSRNAMKDVCDEAKIIRTKYVAKTRTATFKSLSAEDKKKETDKAFYAFVKAIEQEKMYFFMLAVQTNIPVLVVKSPLPKKNESNEKIKKFLGYEWINRKGHEGIHYLNIGVTESDEDNENEADDDTMQEISGINSIATPLFNPTNYYDSEKINTLIRMNFNGQEIAIPDELFENVSLSSIIDIIDFKHTGFNKSFRTKTIREFKYVTKWDVFSLGSLTVSEPEYGANESAIDGNPQKDYRYIRITDINDAGYLNDDWKTAEKIEDKYHLIHSYRWRYFVCSLWCNCW